MKFYTLLLALVITTIGCKHDIVPTIANDPNWENCFNGLQFPDSPISTYYVEGYLDKEHFLIADKVSGFKMHYTGMSVPTAEIEKFQTDSTVIYASPTVSFSNEIGININMPSVYSLIKDMPNTLKGETLYRNATLDKLKVGELSLGIPYDGKSFAITINTKACHVDGGPYPRNFMASSAWGNQNGSYLRLLNINKRTERSIYQDNYNQELTDYELEFEFSVNLYKAPEGKQLWKKLSKGKMKCVMSFFKY